jgi:hypothetical protein
MTYSSLHHPIIKILISNQVVLCIDLAVLLDKELILRLEYSYVLFFSLLILMEGMKL